MKARDDLHIPECLLHGAGDERIALLAFPKVHEGFLAPLSDDERRQVHYLLSEAGAQAATRTVPHGAGHDPLQAIFRKLGVTSRRELIVAALRSGVQPPR